ncbi:MAG: ABC transporter ATP-binding protein [Anaerosomatales bacterium]|nr:ABC transporter ATP-binding protein [Anaerosomatales bacterium]MDT8434803.1 ABC transporter ATP-binding protein [Anaerosomatales bacterium]
MAGEAQTALLEFRGVNTHYGRIPVLKDVNYRVGPGEIVCLLGGNASGKSTTMKTILGIVKPTSGEVLFDGQVINNVRTAERIKRGIATVPENRRLFPHLTVLENLEMGAYTRRDTEGIAADLERVYEIYPRVYERRAQRAGTLSGGEQQMVAFGRALMSRPRLIIMDEPSMGLAPALVDQSFDTIAEINKQGVAVFVVEQNATAALSIADRGYVLQNGRVVMDGTARDLLENEELKRAYLGG